MDFEQMKEQNKVRTIASVEAELDQSIPAKAVSERDGGKGRKLAYLETWYVINRLNQVFGNLGWSSETINLQQVNSEGSRPAYISKVRITIHSDQAPIIKEGTGFGCDKSDLNPHEMAVKEAESDALKRAAMKLGLSMGLALYDKSQEFVEDEPKTPKAAAKAPIAPKSTAPARVIKPEADKADPIQEQISEYVMAAKSQGKITIPQLKEYLIQKFSVSSKAELNAEQAQAFLTYLKGLVETNNQTQ